MDRVGLDGKGTEWIERLGWGKERLGMKKRNLYDIFGFRENVTLPLEQTLCTVFTRKS